MLCSKCKVNERLHYGSHCLDCRKADHKKFLENRKKARAELKKLNKSTEKVRLGKRLRKAAKQQAKQQKLVSENNRKRELPKLGELAEILAPYLAKKKELFDEAKGLEEFKSMVLKKIETSEVEDHERLAQLEALAAFDPITSEVVKLEQEIEKEIQKYQRIIKYQNKKIKEKKKKQKDKSTDQSIDSKTDLSS